MFEFLIATMLFFPFKSDGGKNKKVATIKSFRFCYLYSRLSQSLAKVTFPSGRKWIKFVLPYWTSCCLEVFVDPLGVWDSKGLLYLHIHLLLNYFICETLDLVDLEVKAERVKLDSRVLILSPYVWDSQI